jgi:molybdopterin synthase sulfur carrier subunit
MERTLNILAFASARDVLGFSETIFPVISGDTPRTILERIAPGKISQLSQARPALDLAYVNWDTPVGESSELAILPPVSGG